MVFPLVTPSTQVGVVFPLIQEDNWSGEFADETIWQVQVNMSKVSGAEERECRVTRPTRSFSALCSGLSRTQTARLLANSFQLCKQPQAMPLYPDFSIVTSAGTTTIGLDTTNRRIFVGQRLIFVDPSFPLVIGGSGPYQGQVGTVQSMTTSAVTLSSALTVSVPLGTLVFPLIDSNVSLSQESGGLSDAFAEWQINYDEISGKNTLPALSEENISPEFAYFQGYPIWDYSYNWRDRISVNPVREGTAVQSGNTNLIAVDGENPLLRFEGNYGTYSRADQWRVARFFDSRRGRTLPFWGINPIVMFDSFEIIDATNVRFTNFTYGDHVVPFLQTLAIVASNGAISLHRVNSFDASGAQVQVVLDDAIADPGMSVLHSTSAHLCRFDQDNLRRVWLTDGVCQFSLAHRSLQKEGSFVLL